MSAPTKKRHEILCSKFNVVPAMSSEEFIIKQSLMAYASSNMQHASEDVGTGTLSFPARKDCIYTSCYCEENVWHLCSAVRENHPEELGSCYCVFISNQNQAIPLWQQTASSGEDGLVIWDYHVIFIHKQQDKSCVYDLDSRLDFPCSFEHYTDQGIRSCADLKPHYQRFFRIVPAEKFLATFASDRSHMLDEEGKWLKPPPKYPCIGTQDTTNNIKEFISMDSKVGVGEVMDYWQFYENFSKNGDSSS